MTQPTAPLLELQNVSVKDRWKERGLSRLNLAVAPGRAVHVSAESPDDIHLFMRLLATLEWPHRGRFIYGGERLMFHRYEALLPVKRTIGYIYPMAAMIRNRTIEENLDYQVHYFTDMDAARHKERKEALLSTFGIEGEVGRSPELVGALTLRQAIAVRELLKEPMLLLAEYPEEFAGRGRLSQFIGEVRRILSRGGAFIYCSNYRGLGRELNPVELDLGDGGWV